MKFHKTRCVLYIDIIDRCMDFNTRRLIEDWMGKRPIYNDPFLSVRRRIQAELRENA